MRRSAVEHAATFSWDNTVDALLASYRRAIGEFTARRSVRNLASARRPWRRPSRREAWA
jgi:D-inositol-3-phosphate glycosyltransferase